MDDHHDDDDDDDAEEVLPEVHLARKEKWTSILEQQNKLPLHTRDKINNLVQRCLKTIEREIHNLICGDVPVRYLLNANRDTKEEVENAIRLFPNNLSKPTEIEWADDISSLEYPIHALLVNHGNNYNTFKNETFIALFVRIAMEFDQFEVEERGGLLVRYRGGTINILQRLAFNTLETDANIILQVMRQLQEIGYFNKDDIREYELLFWVCVRTNSTFMENVFPFLVDWDPTALIEVDIKGCTPLFYTPLSCIECFQSVLETGLRYYPKKKGISLLFLKNSGVQEEGSTAFEHACNKFGSDKVMDIIESTLIDCCRITDDDEIIDNISYNTVDALLSAAVDANMVLDGVYFLLRREPDILQKVLPSSTTTKTVTTLSVAAVGGPNATATATTTATTTNRNNSRNGEDNNNNNNNECGLIIPTIDTRKRKRE